MSGKRAGEHFDIDYNQMPSVDETAGEIKRRKAPSSGTLEGWIVCTTPVFFRAHFIGEKTIPHLKQNCPGCKAKNLGECRAYIFVFERQQQTISALDLPLGALPALKQALSYHHTLKGLPISVGRRGKGERARVVISIGQTINPEMSMMPVPSLTAWCENLWADHLRQMIFATQGADAPTTEMEEQKLATPEPMGRAQRKGALQRVDERAAKDRWRTTDNEPIALRDVLNARLNGVLQVNGSHPDASNDPL